MSWAARRRLLILFIVGAVIIAFLTVVVIATFTKAPSCSDNLQNQGEDGIDCGGPCAYLCSVLQQPPTVLFTQAIGNGVGRTDVVASVENKNATAAARNVPYRVTLYGKGQILIQTVTGTVDLPPGATVPIFVPGITSGNQDVLNAFLTIDPSSPNWFVMTRDPRILPTISNIRLGGTAGTPRIEATFSNQDFSKLANVRAIVLVHNPQGSVIAVSSTIVPAIAAQGQAIATFTWNHAFSDVPASIAVVPIVPLP